MSDLVLLGRSPDTKRVLSSPLDRLGGNSALRPDTFFNSFILTKSVLDI
jgi:hypothetical protein